MRNRNAKLRRLRRFQSTQASDSAYTANFQGTHTGIKSLTEAAQVQSSSFFHSPRRKAFKHPELRKINTKATESTQGMTQRGDPFVQAR